MKTVERVLLRSLESTVCEDTLEVRAQEIAAVPNRAKRATLNATHNLVSRYPRQVAKLFGIDYDPSQLEEKHGLQYISSGYEAVVLRRAGKVIKVHKGTSFISEDGRSERVAKKSREHQSMASRLGQFAVPQDVFIAPHPLIPHLRAVQTEQRYLTGLIDPGLVGQSGVGSDTAYGLEKLLDDQPAAFGQIPDFLERSHDLYDNHRLLPDTEGRGNLMVSNDGNLILVDGQPIGTEFPQVQTIVQTQLEQLDSAHKVVCGVY
jgi:hypothetical protein